MGFNKMDLFKNFAFNCFCSNSTIFNLDKIYDTVFP